jgi:undecaprenyl-diphosphatase
VIALIQIPANLGYFALAALVGVESMGIPGPGETALITLGVLARRGQFNITAVIAVAAAAAIVGDNIGYVIGRVGGRRLLEHPGPLEAHRRTVLEKGEPFFARHGAKAVFLGRWFAGLRIAAAWLAGVNRMHWPVFMFWNALGGIAWATSVGLAAYALGPAAESLIKTVGLVGIAVIVVLGAAAFVWRRRRTAARESEA